MLGKPPKRHCWTCAKAERPETILNQGNNHDFSLLVRGVGDVFAMAVRLLLQKVGGFSSNDNHNPRDFLNGVQGEAKRANAAQQNSFEIFPAFAAAVLIAHATGEASAKPPSIFGRVCLC